LHREKHAIQKPENMKKTFPVSKVTNYPEYEPLKHIALAIIKASVNCFKKVNILKEGMEKTEKETKTVFVFNEFLFFFTHIVLRTASSSLSRLQDQKLVYFLDLVLGDTIIHMFHFCWANEQEARFIEYFEKLNKAEWGYSKSKEIYSESNPDSSDTIFGKLAQNVGSMAEIQMKSSITSLVINVSVKECKRMHIDQLISALSDVL
jgi:hypothetical protein